MGDIVQGSLLKGKKHIHFIGIGGSGMFPLVQILRFHGFYITGSDNNETETTEIERKMGIEVFMGQRAENIKGADLIVYTAAIMSDNPELIAAKESGVPTVERSVLLGAVSESYEKAVCIAGTHGKTTATGMLTRILIEAGIDPTAVIGGKLESIGGSGRVGKSEVMVCEACEFSNTFLKLKPYISLILNVDEDHLEFFGNMENIIKAFSEFACLASGKVLFNGDDENSRKAIAEAAKKGTETVTFGYSEKNDYYPAATDYEPGVKNEFTLMHRGREVTRINLNVPGKHNVFDAVAACAAALEVGAKPEDLKKGLAGFFGVKRRFEMLGNIGGITVADDYAHNPRELEVTLNMAKELGYKRVWAVFQPFTYSRTAILFDGFVKALSIPDKVVLSEIMGSREKNTYGIYSKDLCEKIPGAVWYDSFEKMAQHVAEYAQKGDLVITLGCGDVYKCAKILIGKLRNMYN